MPRPKRPKITKVLVDQALAGNRAAWVELVNLIQACIHWTIARRLLRARRTCQQDIRDIKQMTLVALLVDNKAKSWNPSRGSFETFARLVAKEKARDFLKPFKDVSLDDVDGPERHVGRGCSPEGLVAEWELEQKALNMLESEQSPRGRQFMVLLIREERTTEDVCAIMNVPPSKANTVDQRRSRLLKRRKQILAFLGGEQ